MPTPHTSGGPDLRQTLRLSHTTAMVVGTIIGASIFVQPSEMSSALPSIPGLLLAWTVAGLLTVVGSLICAELASAYPRTGGVYVYLSETVSPAAGFLWAWAMFWSMHSGIIAAIAVICARYTAYLVPLSATGQRGMAIAVILLLSAVNYLGVRFGSRVQATFTIGKLLAVAVLIVTGFVAGWHLPHFVGDRTEAALLSRFPAAVAAGLFAFGGWHMVTYAAGETVQARRTIPRALMAGTAIVTACYVMLNVVYFYVLPLDTVIASSRVAADAADAVLGSGGGAIIAALVVFSTFGALSGIVLLGPRVYFSMAGDHRWFGWLGAVHPRFQTPYRAIAIQAAWSSVLVATGTYRVLFTRVVYTEWIFFAALAVGLAAARRRPGYAPAYRMPGYPAVPALFAVVAIAIAVSQLVSDPPEALIGLLLVGAGLPAYYLGRRRQAPSEDAARRRRDA
ncbi:MAG TPA: amino acid permease [Vicinamibacterales bacterium]